MVTDSERNWRCVRRCVNSLGITILAELFRNGKGKIDLSIRHLVHHHWSRTLPMPQLVLSLFPRIFLAFLLTIANRKNNSVTISPNPHVKDEQNLHGQWLPIRNTGQFPLPYIQSVSYRAITIVYKNFKIPKSRIKIQLGRPNQSVPGKKFTDTFNVGINHL